MSDDVTSFSIMFKGSSFLSVSSTHLLAAQIYSGNAPNYVVWNDQFYDDPVPKIDPPCIKYCAKPWGHSTVSNLIESMLRFFEVVFFSPCNLP